MKGLIIAAPSSGAGKTTVTLGLIAALTRAGHRIRPFKVGPDYIDPTFLCAAAGGVPCANLDPWAMRDQTLARLISSLADTETALVEGVMGLHDGPGSTALLARKTGWPIVLVIDARKSAQTAAAVAQGLALRDPDLKFAGFVFNRVASARHEAMIRDGLRGQTAAWFLPSAPDLALPSRHLGLHQAHEQRDLQGFLTAAAQWAAPLCPLIDDAEAASGELGAFLSSAQLKGAGPSPSTSSPERWPDFGLTFAYLHTMIPKGTLFLPGGYPELYLDQIKSDPNFLPNLRQAAAAGVPIYGECGGFMVLGEAIIDADGVRHDMAGLLPLITSFAEPKRHLGYREMRSLSDFAWGRAGETWRGHEFHYTQAIWQGQGQGQDQAEPLFQAYDAYGADLGPQGLKRGSVAGSYLHLIDKVD